MITTVSPTDSLTGITYSWLAQTGRLNYAASPLNSLSIILASIWQCKQSTDLVLQEKKTKTTQQNPCFKRKKKGHSKCWLNKWEGGKKHIVQKLLRYMILQPPPSLGSRFHCSPGAQQGGAQQCNQEYKKLAALSDLSLHFLPRTVFLCQQHFF